MLAEERYTRLIEGYPNPYWTTAAIYTVLLGKYLILIKP